MKYSREKFPIPVIDLFAGPGGLSEGFSCFEGADKSRPFAVKLSIEKESNAHQTLLLRSFFRQFEPGEAPEEYYKYLQGKITRDELFACYPLQATAARKASLLAELGKPEHAELIHDRIATAVAGRGNAGWVLIGGPPCQAYSVMGRSRMRTSKPKFEEDERHTLYEHYLEVIAEFKPNVFVMENVPGIYSSSINGTRIFPRILDDLHSPTDAVRRKNGQTGKGRQAVTYRIHSLVINAEISENHRLSDIVIKAEEYGIPQARHRVILLGIRSDLNVVPDSLTKLEGGINTYGFLFDLSKFQIH